MPAKLHTVKAPKVYYRLRRLFICGITINTGFLYLMVLSIFLLDSPDLFDPGFQIKHGVLCFLDGVR